MNRFYILPYILQTWAKGETKAPKYVIGNFTEWGVIKYGSDDICICFIEGITQAEHDLLSAQPDVMAVPENLDQNLTQNAVDTITTFFESLNIPAQWINTNRTYREVLKVTIGLFQLNQRWAGLTNGSSIFKEGFNLNTRYNQLPQAARDRLLECFDSLEIDRSMLTNTSTMREALYEFGIQFANRKITIHRQEI